VPGSDFNHQPSSLAACPDCGREVDAETSIRGRAFRCEGCDSWLFRQLWKPSDASDRCRGCAAPLDGKPSCGFCGERKRGRPWFQNGRLARFLSALRGRQAVRSIAIDRIRADSFQPRLSVDVNLFEGLRRSLDQVGMIQPLLLRERARDRTFSVISGHRRLIAARQLGWAHVPARALRVSERKAIQIRISDNLHREPPSLLELAEALERFFLVAGDEGRQALGSTFGLAGEHVDRLLSLLQASPTEREDMIYGLDRAESNADRDDDPLEEIRRILDAGLGVRAVSEENVRPLR